MKQKLYFGLNFFFCKVKKKTNIDLAYASLVVGGAALRGPISGREGVVESRSNFSMTEEIADVDVSCHLDGLEYLDMQSLDHVSGELAQQQPYQRAT